MPRKPKQPSEPDPRLPPEVPVHPVSREDLRYATGKRARDDLQALARAAVERLWALELLDPAWLVQLTHKVVVRREGPAPTIVPYTPPYASSAPDAPSASAAPSAAPKRTFRHVPTYAKDK